MTNVLNSILANQPIYPGQKGATSFTFDSDGKVKPMQDKGRLLPSRIIGSPIEYAKDLKKDIVSIGKAAKGQANDHELGRINDVAMKVGSLALAAYLFAKNPLKLSKAMEFVGFGTFFASMALWPKLAIQAPLKARTGVDIHQKYIDSQGRKKMLYQDPQYVLTDLYTKEELNKIGDKLNVHKDMPDRDNFIKQRAQKTALQGNTLWMMTAGLASPIMSGLACNVIEKPLGKALEQHELNASARALETLENGITPNIFARFKQNKANKQLEEFLAQHTGEPMSAGLIAQLKKLLGQGVDLEDAIAEQLSGMTREVTMDMDFVRNALQSQASKAALDAMTEEQKAILQEGIANNSIAQIAKAFPKKQQTSVRQMLDNAVKKGQPGIIDEGAKNTIRQIHQNITEFATRKNVLDRFVNARVGDSAGTYIANQWGRVGKKLLKSLGLRTKDLKKISNGDMSVLEEHIAKLASDPKKYDKAISSLMKLIGDYEDKTDVLTASGFTEQVSQVYEQASEAMRNGGLERIGKRITGDTAAGTLKEAVQSQTKGRIMGAKASFYRLMQTLDLYKQISDNSFRPRLEQGLIDAKLPVTDKTVERLTEIAKKIMLHATPTDYSEKLKTAKFGLSEEEYRVLLKLLFGKDSSTALDAMSDATPGLMKGLKAYKEQFIENVANKTNGITPQLARCNVDGQTNTLKSNSEFIGDPIASMIKKASKELYNSKKWLHIFGGAMAALTVVTLVAGLAIGRKGKTEKQVEAENKLNG
ncbi:hypothetical protein IJ182_04180 [bacterium]|nr:hypothetical protein [bacterium]